MPSSIPTSASHRPSTFRLHLPSPQFSSLSLNYLFLQYTPQPMIARGFIWSEYPSGAHQTHAVLQLLKLIPNVLISFQKLMLINVDVISYSNIRNRMGCQSGRPNTSSASGRIGCERWPSNRLIFCCFFGQSTIRPPIQPKYKNVKLLTHNISFLKKNFRINLFI